MLISKVDSEKCLLVFCRYFVYILSIFAWFSFLILSVFCSYSVRIIARVHRNQHKAILRLRIRPPQVVPLIVSSHLLNVPFFVSSSRNVCHFSVDLLKCVLGFLTAFRLFCCRCLLGFLSVHCPYSVRIIACVHRNQHNATLRLRILPPTSGPPSCIVPLVKRPIHCIMTEYNKL